MDIIVEAEGREDVLIRVEAIPCPVPLLRKVLGDQVDADVAHCDVYQGGVVVDEVEYLRAGGAPERVEIRMPDYAVAQLRLRARYDMDGIDEANKKVDEAVFCRAIHHGDFDRVRTMIQTGWVDARVLELSLQSACDTRPEERELVELLLEEGVPVNGKDVHGRTPLILAAGRGCENVCVQLVRAGADPNARDVSGWTPLFLALKHGMVDLATALVDLRRTDLDATDQMGSTPLLVAVQYGMTDVVRRLVENAPTDDMRRAMVNQQNRLLFTPLYHAVQKGDIETATLLLDAGADPNICLASGETPLFVSARNGDDALTVLLLLYGATAGQRTRRGSTALMGAASHGHRQVVETLLDAGADPTEADNAGANSFTLASLNRHRAVIDILAARVGIIHDDAFGGGA